MSVKVSSWVWERSRTRGNDRLVLLAIADHCNDAGLEAYPSIDHLAAKTRLDRATVFRCLKRIAAIGELRITGNRGRHVNDYTILMDTLSLKDSRQRARGPSRRGPGNRRCRPADNAPQPSQPATVEPSQIATVEPSQIATVEPSRYRDTTRRGTATPPVAVPRPDPSLERPLNPVLAAAAADPHSATTTAAAAGTLPDPVDEYLAWWEFAYPAYNAGATSSPTRTEDGGVVLELLKGRTPAQLRSMAIVMWTVTGKPHWRGGHVGGTLVEPDAAEAWIAQSDRSIRVLRHKADWLHRQVTRMPAWWADCPHTPRCTSGCQRSLEAGPDGT